MPDGPAEDYRASHLDREVAAAYDRNFWDSSTAQGLNWELERSIVDDAIAEFAPIDAARVVDFACGTGRVLSHLESRFHDPIGVDVSAAMIEHARDRCARSTLVVADVTRHPQAVGSGFDVITAFRFFLNAEDSLRSQALAWMRTVVASDGVVIANVHLNPSSLRGTYLRLRWRGRRRTPMLRVGTVRRMFERADFEVVATTGYDYLPYRRDGSRLRLAGLRARLERAFVRWRIPAAVAGSFVVVARPAVRSTSPGR